MKQSKILVVEDDPDINAAIRIRLRAAGHQVYQAEDGLQGLLAALREEPDLMILDISLPAGDGFSIVERARLHPERSDIPFIVITASKRPELRTQAFALGASAFLEKPYDAALLLSEVDRAIHPPAVAPARAPLPN